MSAVLITEEAVGRALPLVAGALGVSGAAVAVLPSKVRMRTELRKRWRSWAVAAPVFQGALFFGAGGAFALAAALGVIAVSEYVRIAGLPRAEHLVLVAASVVLPGLAWRAPELLDVRSAALLLVGAALPSLLTGDHASGFTRTARTLVALVWIPVSLTGLVVLGDTAVAVGLGVAFGDVGAWCGGMALGRRGPLARPLSPLSPSKTWAGVLGTAAVTAAVLAVIGAFSVLLWLAILAGCVLGDLLESMVKREAGVKDAGTWLPGFGGLLDRIDSLVLALLLTMVVAS
ncbi:MULTISPECIES: phosphatidate cytidylyltransferase [Streptomyces]|uniref:Phosphatidate cytidylyltransferase n=1 Tax=Streptomyces lienomycini TaxID=284035 RepID=A0ABV9X0Y0_9ACTN|nr:MULTISPECIES: phosphatidate cytidylyltransferase [Streptomyces]